MAQRLIPAPFTLSVLLAASSAGQPALAQGLGDPMRPPAISTADEAKPDEGGSSRLQTVLISPTRRLAVIDGRTVGLGERIGDATLVAIAPSQVILQRGARWETLKMHPGMEKKVKP
jgi:MSHA biogenesis protein MshK